MSSRFPLVAYSMLRPFVAALMPAGVDTTSILRDHGLDADALFEPDRFMPAANWYRLVEDGAKRIGNPYFGFEVGVRAELAALPNFELVPLFEGSLGELLVALVVDSGRVTSAARYDVSTGPTLSVLSTHRVFHPSPRPAQVDAFFAGFMLQVLRRYAGATWDAGNVSVQVCDPRAVPQSVSPVKVTRGTLKGATFRFPSAWMLLTADRDSAASVPTRCPQAIEYQFLAEIKTMLASQLHRRELTLAELGRQTGMSVAGLKRLFAGAGTSYSGELKSLRQDRARTLLTDSSISIADVGKMVGYPNPAAFSRAFREWSGQTPSAYREQLPDE